MPYLLDYLEHQFATFDEQPFNAVDAAVLSQMCMISGKGVIPGLKERSSFTNVFTLLQNAFSARENEKPATFRDLLLAEHFSDMFTGLDPARIKSCLFAAAASPRFRTVTASDYLSLFDTEREMQFAAMTFSQGTDFSVVTFRGTDASRTGWKEDFNMAFSTPVPAQEQALRYLEAVAPKLPGKLYVNGHSKGGNLAEYAALKASPAVQDRIECVYVLDGPGFKEGFFSPEDYAPIIERMYKVAPVDSIIGILLESPVPLHVVPSNAQGFAQHSVFTWEIAENPSGIGTDFVYLDGLSDSAAFVRSALREWLGRYNDVERIILVDVLFRALDASGADDVMDLISSGPRTVELFMEASRNLDDEDKELLSTAGREFVEVAGGLAAGQVTQQVAQQVAHGIRSGALQLAQAVEDAATKRKSLREK